jgi:hypothetical protein
MRFRVLHRTHSTDGTPVTESFNEIYFKSLNNRSQSMSRFVLKAHPPPRLRHCPPSRAASFRPRRTLRPTHGDACAYAPFPATCAAPSGRKP